MRKDEELSQQLKVMMGKAKDSLEVAKNYTSKIITMMPLLRRIMQSSIHFRQLC